jgi:hypothetical protein
MKTHPLQMVIIDLEDGRRGVFVGRPLIGDAMTDEECQVENVWFTNIQEVPDGATVEQLTRLAMTQISQQIGTLQ